MLSHQDGQSRHPSTGGRHASHDPLRPSLGAALLQAGRAGEAEAVYRQDLKSFPANGWSLFGLRQSLAAQGKSTVETDAALRGAWAQADIQLTGSRF